MTLRYQLFTPPRWRTTARRPIPPTSLSIALDGERVRVHAHRAGGGYSLQAAAGSPRCTAAGWRLPNTMALAGISTQAARDRRAPAKCVYVAGERVGLTKQAQLAVEEPERVRSCQHPARDNWRT
jgi:hypothetical protein